MLFRSKGMPLAFLVLALITTLSACGQSSTHPPNHATHKLVVIVQGIGTRLTTDDVAGNGGYGDTSDFGTIENYLKRTSEFSGAQYMVYSYAQTLGLDGQPASYDCNMTYYQTVALDESKMAAQITTYTTNHANTEVYIVSHSLGGVISFAFLADLIENNHSLTLSNGGMLKGVAILDSPLGGVIDDPRYFSVILARVHTAIFGCNPVHIGEEAVNDLTSLLKKAHDTTELGMSASIFQMLLKGGNGEYLSNQIIAKDAANKGARILVVGNENDITWRPQICNAGPDFLSTEYLQELGEQNNKGALYSRLFLSPSGTLNGLKECPTLIATAAHHFDVLNNINVEKAIWETFTGKPVDQLNPVTDFPGGEWISVPANNAVDTESMLHLAAKAYPTQPTDPSIQKVNFTLEVNGTWTVICSPDKPSSGNIYTCDVDLSRFQFPVGHLEQLQVSFDVYDQAENVNLAPNGIHTFFYIKQGDMTGFSQFVGTWSSYPGGDIIPPRTLVIQTDGIAIYTGYVGISCSRDPRPPCDNSSGGLNTTIVFYQVDNTTPDGPIIDGIIVSGTGDRNHPDSILTVGSNITATLYLDILNLDIDGILMPKISG